MKIKHWSQHAASKQELALNPWNEEVCWKVFAAEASNAGLHLSARLGHSLMLQCWPEASRSYSSMSNTARHLAEITPQTLRVLWLLAAWAAFKVKPCQTMEVKTKNIKLRETVLWQKASLQLGILARSYQRLQRGQEMSRGIGWLSKNCAKASSLDDNFHGNICTKGQ